MSDSNSSNKKSIFREIFLEGFVKFAGEIVGVILIAAFWYLWPELKSWVSNLESHTDSDSTVISQPAEKPKLPAMSDEEFVELCEAGDAVKVEEAIRNGVNINAMDYYKIRTALMVAAGNGRIEIAELLLKHGADVNADNNDGDTALIDATRGGHIKMVELLLKHGANVNAYSHFFGESGTALMYAERRGYTEIANLLRSYGAKE